MPRFFILEAVIGAGKTTLLQQLQRVLESKGLRVVCVPEPVDIWNETGALQAFYSDIPGKAYEFQTFAYATRCIGLSKIVRENPGVDIFLIERSVISDRHLFVRMLQEDGMFDALQNIQFEYWHRCWDQLLPFESPTGFIYLAPSLGVTLDRIRNRNRVGELVSEEYQRKLMEKHEEVFGPGLAPLTNDVATILLSNGTSAPVLRVYSDADYRRDDDHEVIQTMISFILSSNTPLKKNPEAKET